MSELTCPVCKADSYLNPNIKIYTSPCFHRLCESCLYKNFQQGCAPCPECGTLLRRINFISSTFEDIEVEREMKMRRLMAWHFNRKRSEFGSVVEYNNYLEEYENVLAGLMECKNETAAKEQIAQIEAVGGILLPAKVASEKESSGETTKRQKSEESWFVFQTTTNDGLVIGDDAVVPSNMAKTVPAEGLTKREMLDFLVYSLLEINV